MLLRCLGKGRKEEGKALVSMKGSRTTMKGLEIFSEVLDYLRNEPLRVYKIVGSFIPYIWNAVFYMSSSNVFPSLQPVNNVSLFPFYLIRKTGLITV